MVNAGRVACIFTPFALCTASLVCIIIVFLGGLHTQSTSLGDYYFFKADLTELDVLPGTEIDDKILEIVRDATDLQDSYSIYLWNYCSSDGDDRYSFCSKREPYFAFDPVEAWGLEETAVEDAFPQELKDGLETYKTVSKWMFVAYVAALVATCLELVIGISAIFSRWGSFVTTFIALFASLFIIAASVTATALFSILLGVFNGVFEEYGIQGSLGAPIMRTTWLAVVFSLGASLFWLFSTCCCSGRSPYKGMKDVKRVKAEKTPYTYEHVGSPYLGPQGSFSPHVGGRDQQVPMQNLPSNAHGGSYEPFRTSHV